MRAAITPWAMDGDTGDGAGLATGADKSSRQLKIKYFYLSIGDIGVLYHNLNVIRIMEQNVENVLTMPLACQLALKFCLLG